MMWEDANYDRARMAAAGVVILLSVVFILALEARAGPPPPLFPASPIGRLQAHGPGVLRAVTVDRYPSEVTVDEQTNRVFVVTGSTLTVLDGRTGMLVRTINQADAGPVTVATGAGTSRIFVINSAIAGSSYPGGPGYHSREGSVDVLDARTLRYQHSVRIGPGPQAVAVDARRGRVYVLESYTATQNEGAPDPTSRGSVTVLDARSGRILHTVDVGLAPTALSVDPSTGHVFVTNRDSHNVTVLDGGRGRVVTTIPLAGAPLDVAMFPPRPRQPGAGRVFVATVGSAPSGRSVVLLDARSGVVVGTTDAGYGARALTVDARANRVFVATDTGISVLDGTTGAVLRRVGAGVPPIAMAMDDRSGHLFVASAAGSVDVLDTRGALLRTIAVGGNPSTPAVDTRTERVFVADQDADRVSVLDAATAGRRRLHPPASSPVLSTTAESDPLNLELDARTGRLFVVNDHSVDILDARSGHSLRAISGTAFPLAAAIDTTDDRLFVLQTAHHDDVTARGSVAFLSLRGGTAIRTTAIGSFDASGMPELVPDPRDHRVLAVVSYTTLQDAGSVHVLDALNGRLLHTTQVGPSPTAALATRTGRLFVVCYGVDSGPGQVLVLDARTGRVIRTLPLRTTEPEPPVVDNRAGRVFIADSDALLVLDARSGATVHRIRGGAPESVTLDERTGRVFVGNLRGEDTISTIDAATGSVLHTIHDGFDHVAFQVDDVSGQLLAYPSDGTDSGYDALLLDGRTGIMRRAVALTGDIIAISPSTGHWLVAPPSPSALTLDTAPGRLLVLDNRNGKTLRSVTFGQAVGSLPIASDARTGRVFVGDQSNQTVTMLDAARL